MPGARHLVPPRAERVWLLPPAGQRWRAPSLHLRLCTCFPAGMCVHVCVCVCFAPIGQRARALHTTWDTGTLSIIQMRKLRHEVGWALLQSLAQAHTAWLG